MLMRVFITAPGLLCPELLPRQLFLAIHQHIDLGRGDAAAIHLRNFEASSDVEGSDRFFQQLRRHSGIDQGAQKHVAAHAGKTIEIGNSHEEQLLAISR